MAKKVRLFRDTEAKAAGLTEDLLRDAIRRDASDIHFQWVSSGVMVRYRECGLLVDIQLLPDAVGRKIISHLKVLGGMNIADRRRPQDGRLFYPCDDRQVDLRLASIPTLYGENLTIRVFDRDASLRSLDCIGLESEDVRRVKTLIRVPHGLILVTGPTGAGKSTTLYSILEQLNDPCRNIITVEDPIEYDIDRANQIGIQRRLGVDFHECLRASFRHDPDVIMIGEIRDSETAKIAVRAALSGHLVFSTLHTESAIGTFTSLVQLGISPFLASSALLGVITQQLVRRICTDCRQKFEFSLDSLGAEARREFEEVRCDEGNPFFAIGTGCEECRQTGFRGRIGIFEILEVTPSLRQAFGQQESRERIEELARSSGWQNLQRAGFRKIIRGETTIEEVLRVVPVHDSLMEVTETELSL